MKKLSFFHTPFSGKGPTFSASYKTYEHIFKKGWKSNGTDKKRLV